MTKKLFYKSSGIYQIRNLVNGKRYIGQSMYLVDRRYSHFRLLEIGKHHSIILQNAYNKYGKSNFSFEVILYCDIDSLDRFEQTITDKLCPEYNVRTDVTNNRGHKMSDKTKKKLYKINKGRKASLETRKRMSESRKGVHLHLSESTLKKMSERMMGHKINLGRKQSQEEKDKRAESIRRFWKTHKKVISDDTRHKSSISHINSSYTKRGEQNNKAKLTKEDVIEIRNLHKQGKISMYALSKKFNVSDVAISNVCRYKTWKHII